MAHDIKMNALMSIIVYTCLIVGAWIIAFVMVGIQSEEAVDLQYYPFDIYNQIVRDWARKPYSSLLVTDSLTCPSSHSELVFSRPWYGTTVGCDCIGIS